MYKLEIPKIVKQLIDSTEDQMTAELEEIEKNIIQSRHHRGWIGFGRTDGLTTAFRELNRPAPRIPLVRAALVRHLAELYAFEEMVKGLKNLKATALLERERLKARPRSLLAGLG